MKESLLWVDIETTGLFPDKGYPLEIAFRLTDRNLNDLASYESVVLWQGAEKKKVMDSFAPAARDMHEKNGLLQLIEQEQGKTIERIESEAILHLLVADKDDDYWRPCKIAGSKPGFDRDWLHYWFPHLARLPHYRDFDMNTVRSLFRVPKPPEHQQGHRAMEDLLIDLNLMRKVKEILDQTKLYEVFEMIYEK